MSYMAYFEPRVYQTVNDGRLRFRWSSGQKLLCECGKLWFLLQS